MIGKTEEEKRIKAMFVHLNVASSGLLGGWLPSPAPQPRMDTVPFLGGEARIHSEICSDPLSVAIVSFIRSDLEPELL